jgi:phosphoribosyl-AMP cyclohydrolase
METSIPPKVKAALENGLIAAVAQDVESHEVLMLAWMNEAALIQTIQTKRVTYFSRSRNKLWVKGETSGNYQELISLDFDCDGDALLIQVRQHGPACHTGNFSCFHEPLDLKP